jgi:hypothetical protein
MAFVLLVLGVVTAVAGLLLVAPGLMIHDGSFDIGTITPGVVAVVGGLVLIGLGLAVRVLQRIEKALGARALAGAPVVGDAAVAAAADPAVRIPFPAKSETNPLPPPVATSAAVSTEDAALERLRVTFPKLTSVEGRSGVEKTDSASPPPVIGPPENANEWENKAIVARRGNGASPAHVAPRFELKLGGVSPGNRPKAPVFKSVAEARRAAGTATAAHVTAPVELAAPPAAAETPSTGEAAVVPAPVAEEPAAVSVLKSGVVEGMAYTLYSDGSIEAQLPQGTLRFGSIAALREHIESAS